MQLPSVDAKRHERFRMSLRRHQNAAVKAIPTPLMRKVARELGLLRGNQLAIDSDGELVILFDHLIYDRKNRGKTTAQRYLEQLPPSDEPVERLVREAMAGQRYSLFEVASLHPGVGLVHRDLVRGGTVFVVDRLMSQTISVGALMAERLLPLPDYWAPTGAGFPITPEAAWEVQQTLLPALEASEEDMANLSPDANAELAAALIRLGFEEGSTGEVAFR